MKQKSAYLLTAAGFVVLLTVVLQSCGGGGYGGGGSAPMSTVQVVTCPSGTSNVSISAAGFDPSSITVPVTTTVKWTNNDSTTHTVTSTTVPLYGTFDVQVNPSASVCLRFTAAGIYNYRCTIHPTMTGIVIVQ